LESEVADGLKKLILLLRIMADSYVAQVGFICDNEKNLSLEARRAIYTLVRSASENEYHISENRAQNVSWVHLDRLGEETLSAICTLVQRERDRLNQPAGI